MFSHVEYWCSRVVIWCWENAVHALGSPAGEAPVDAPTAPPTSSPSAELGAFVGAFVGANEIAAISSPGSARA
jgi:hypothetical protein